MTQPNITALLAVAGGLAAATLPSAARANCGPGASNAAASVDLSPQPAGIDPRAEYTAGVAALNAGNYAAARAAFDRVLNVAPRNAGVLYMAGYTRTKTDDWPRALKYFKKATREQPDMIDAHAAMGVAYVRTNDLTGARGVVADLERQMATCGDGCAQATELKAAIAQVTAAIGASDVVAEAQPAAPATTG